MERRLNDPENSGWITDFKKQLKFPEDSPDIDKILDEETQKNDKKVKNPSDQKRVENELKLDSPLKRQKTINIDDEEKEFPLYSDQKLALKRTNSNISSPGRSKKARPTGRFGGGGDGQQEFDDFLQ